MAQKKRPATSGRESQLQSIYLVKSREEKSFADDDRVSMLQYERCMLVAVFLEKQRGGATILSYRTMQQTKEGTRAQTSQQRELKYNNYIAMVSWTTGVDGVDGGAAELMLLTSDFEMGNRVWKFMAFWNRLFLHSSQANTFLAFLLAFRTINMGTLASSRPPVINQCRVNLFNWGIFLDIRHRTVLRHMQNDKYNSCSITTRMRSFEGHFAIRCGSSRVVGCAVMTPIDHMSANDDVSTWSTIIN